MDKRQIKKEKEVALQFPYECMSPVRMAFDAGNDFRLIWQPLTELLRSPCHFPTHSKSFFYKATSQQERNASPLHDFRLTLALGGRNHTNRLLPGLTIGF